MQGHTHASPLTCGMLLGGTFLVTLLGYCAALGTVVSPSGNITSRQPLEVKEQHPDLSGARGSGPIPNSVACTTWNATVIVQGSYQPRTIQATVSLFKSKVPQCKKLHVALWTPGESARDQSIPCVDNIRFVAEETRTIANFLVVVKFENLSAGNYCVRVSPRCEPPEDCLTLTSKVIELPSGGSPVPADGAEARQSRLLWLLLLSLLVGAALVIALGAFWVWRHSLLARKKPFIVGSPLPPFHKPWVDPGPPVVKVVYSRDSETHVAAVSRLCELLRRELGFRVEWDEAATHLAHVTHDWAMAMAQLPCPHYNPAVKAATPVKMLVIESDGALLKHQAYRQHKDLGLVSESNVDELYHTTYAALLSNHAQALGDYCHITVARLPYTTLPDRLDLVPEKRYLLPEHLQPLLQALLHGTTLPESRAELALRSEAHSHFSAALADAGNSHNEKGFAEDSLCGKLWAVLAHS
uniref:Conserved plasma membrane protein n=1 Tax=Rhipicephalus zambeziensis TaxID=60191 RepID=A0A224YM46_9ACAR